MNTITLLADTTIAQDNTIQRPSIQEITDSEIQLCDKKKDFTKAQAYQS
jgi:hypothetical protein